MKTLVANFAAFLAVFAVCLLTMGLFDPITGGSMCYALAIALVILAYGIYAWQPNGMLDTPGQMSLKTFAAFGAILFGLSLLRDFWIAGANPFDPSQWHLLEKVGGPFGFYLTAFGGVIGALLLLATLVRRGILRAFHYFSIK